MSSVTKGATNVTRYFQIVEDVGGTNPGEPKTGLLHSSLTSASYVRQGAARTAITPVTLASASAAHSDGGFIEVDATNCPGLYRFDVPDAAFASGADLVVIYIVAGNNAYCAPLEVDLTAFDLQTATPNVNVSTISANAITAASIAANAITAAKIAADAIGASQFAQAAADKVWSTTARILTAGTNIVLAKGVGLTGLNDLSAAAVNAEVDTALADYGAATPANVATELATYDGPTRAELTSDINSVLAILGTPAGASIAADLVTIAAYLDTEIAAILEDTGTTLPAQIAALNNLSAAQVNSEMLDVLFTDTVAELGGAPAANAPLGTKIAWVAMVARNKILQTDSVQTLRNDADSADVATAAVSDVAGTFTRDKWT